jgi:hypothetical protein
MLVHETRRAGNGMCQRQSRGFALGFASSGVGKRGEHCGSGGVDQADCPAQHGGAKRPCGVQHFARHGLPSPGGNKASSFSSSSPERADAAELPKRAKVRAGHCAA